MNIIYIILVRIEEINDTIRKGKWLQMRQTRKLVWFGITDGIAVLWEVISLTKDKSIQIHEKIQKSKEWQLLLIKSAQHNQNYFAHISACFLAAYKKIAIYSTSL